MNRRFSSNALPLGFADQLLDLEMRLEQQESIELIQTLTKLYNIGVDYYLQNDIKKAQYLQRKLNGLTVRAIRIRSFENRPPSKITFQKKMREEVEKINDYESTYLAQLVHQSQRSQKRIQECVLADLTLQEQKFQERMLKRIRSAGKL